MKPRYMGAATVGTGKGEAEDASIRRYRVTVGFRHPTDAATLTQEQIESRPAGDSGLVMPSDVGLRFGAGEDREPMHLFLIRNDAGRLARAQIEVRARSTAHANEMVTPIIGYALSRLAFDFGALVVQHWIHVEGLDSGYEEVGVIYRGADVEFTVWPEWASRQPSPFFRSAFAVYREGLTSTNAYYAVLCFQRVIEGARHYRGLQSAYAKAHGIDPSRPKLVLEADEAIIGSMVELVGESCDRVADELRDRYRTAVAHGVRAGEPLLVADQLQVENRYWVALPAARQVARKLLGAEWDFRAKLGADRIPELDDATFA